MRMTGKTRIDFMGKRMLFLGLSTLLVLASLAGLVVRGLNLGLDFTGGVLIEVGYPESVDPAEVRKVLEAGGFRDLQVQHFGSSRDILIRIAPEEGKSNAMLSSRVLELLQAANSKVEMRRVEFVGPQVGEELIEKGGLAVLYALIGILIYVTLRFEYKFALGSIGALIHDVLITLGVFAWTQIEFDLTVLAAILAVIGYSLNDTIVVFDRIRENFRKLRKGSPVDIINRSINETISRTLVTSLTTLLVLLALFFLGGEIIHAFALALIVGVVVGTYSSIYIASTVTLLLGVSKQDLMPTPKEGSGAVDDRP